MKEDKRFYNKNKIKLMSNSKLEVYHKDLLRKYDNASSKMKSSYKRQIGIVENEIRLRIKNSYGKKENEMNGKQKKGSCAIKFFGICFGLLIIVIILVALSTSGDNDSPKSEEASIDIETCCNSLTSQKNALYDILEKYNSGEESKNDTIEKLSGISEGIENNIKMIQAAEDTELSETLESLATTYKIIADRNCEYIKTGDESELEDANNINSRIEELEKQLEGLQ